jgi:hypothetical protein
MMTLLTTQYTPSTPTPFHASFWRRLTSGCLMQHDYPVWRRLNPSDAHLWLECPRCGDQRRALESA